MKENTKAGKLFIETPREFLQVCMFLPAKMVSTATEGFTMNENQTEEMARRRKSMDEAVN
jgi:hypothetical protein